MTDISKENMRMLGFFKVFIRHFFLKSFHIRDSIIFHGVNGYIPFYLTIPAKMWKIIQRLYRYCAQQPDFSSGTGKSQVLIPVPLPPPIFWAMTGFGAFCFCFGFPIYFFKVKQLTVMEKVQEQLMVLCISLTFPSCRLHDLIFFLICLMRW